MGGIQIESVKCTDGQIILVLSPRMPLSEEGGHDEQVVQIPLRPYTLWVCPTGSGNAQGPTRNQQEIKTKGRRTAKGEQG
jgi:hypothetical protein